MFLFSRFIQWFIFSRLRPEIICLQQTDFPARFHKWIMRWVQETGQFSLFLINTSCLPDSDFYVCNFTQELHKRLGVWKYGPFSFNDTGVITLLEFRAIYTAFSTYILHNTNYKYDCVWQTGLCITTKIMNERTRVGQQLHDFLKFRFFFEKLFLGIIFRFNLCRKHFTPETYFFSIFLTKFLRGFFFFFST